MNVELAVRGSLIFSPGQMLENKIGLDAALFSRNPKFWQLWTNRRYGWWAHKTYRSGSIIEAAWWHDFEQQLNSSSFPKLKFNLFIQHKRPEFIRSPKGGERQHWNNPYFRYYINPQQQKRLYTLEQKLGSQGITVYACPAFWETTDLWNFIVAHSLIENTNFVEPHQLEGHNCYTFVNGGKIGKACSEPKNIESLNLLKYIDQMLEKETDFRSNSEFIHSLSKKVTLVMQESFEGLKDIYERIVERSMIGNSLANSFNNILTFVALTNLSWSVAAIPSSE